MRLNAALVSGRRGGVTTRMIARGGVAIGDEVKVETA